MSITEFLDEIDRRFGDTHPCPVCGGVEWHATAIPVTLAATQGTMLDAPMQVAMVTCVRCRFLRFHLMNPLGELPPPE